MTARLARPLALLGIVGGFALLLFGGGLWAGIYYSDVRLTLVVAGGLGVGIWLLLALPRPEIGPRSHLAAAFAASLGAFAISGLAAWQPRLGVDYLLYAMLLTALYLLLVRIFSEPYFARQLVAVVTVFTIGISGWYLITVFQLWLAFWAQLGRFAIPPLRPGYEGLWLGNPNALASLLVLLFLSSAAGVGFSTGRRRFLVALMAVLVAVAVLLTGSRGSWLGLALAAAAAVVVWPLSADRRTALLRYLARRRVQVGLLAVVIGATAVAVILAPALASRIGEQAAETRTSFWAASIRMFQDRPLTGLGPGAWAPARLPYSIATDTDYYIPHAHNVPLQVASEFGLVGIAAALVVVVSVGRLVMLGLEDAQAETRAAAWSALLGCVYLAGQQLVDAYIHQPAILLALALPLARLDALVPFASSVAAGRTRRALTVTLLVGVGTCIVLTVPIERAAKAQEGATAAADDADWRAAAASASEAAREDPSLAPYAFLLGLALAHNGDSVGGLSWLERAASLDDLPQAWLDVAQLRFARGDDIAAAHALARAVRMGRQQPEIAMAAADLAIRLGDARTATELLSDAMAVAPSLASDPTLRTGEWASIRSVAVAEAGGTALPWQAFMLQLEDENVAAAAAEASFGAPRQQQAVWAISAWSGDQSGFDSLHSAARGAPLDYDLVALCRRVARHGRDAGGPSSNWDCSDAGWSPRYPLVRIGVPSEGQILPDPQAYPHPLFAFRRWGPQDMLVPGLLRLHSELP